MLAGYIGRFAPSPTGPLHLGSLVAAVGSYIDARAAGGRWLLRIEDIDPPRETPGSAQHILSTLERFGFSWDGPVMRQSQRTTAYRDAVRTLLDQGLAFTCSCSRSELAAAQIPLATEELHYPGWCRRGPRHPDSPLAVRYTVDEEVVQFDDAIHGCQVHQLVKECGDFVIRRRDGLYAYQLAVVVDDAAQGVTHVVRGLDLLASTPRQIVLQRALGLPTPVYAHLPLVTDANGIKLSKSSGAAAVDADQPSRELCRALHVLQQSPPADLMHAPLTEVWDWAIHHWRVQPLRGLRSVALDDAT